MSPISLLHSSKGEELKKCELKFQFCDDALLTNVFVAPLFNQAAENAQQRVKAGEVYEVSLRLSTQMSKAGREFLTASLNSVMKEGEELVMTRGGWQSASTDAVKR